MTNSRTVGERIRRLRLASQLGQVEFAARLGVASGSVSKLENGRSTVSAEMLELVGTVLDCSPRFLQTEVEAVPTSRPWLRAYADAPKRVVDRQIAECTLVGEVIDLLGLRVLPDSIPRFSGDLADDSEIEEFALEVRAAAQLGEGDVVGNAVRAAERLGCVVLPMEGELGRHLGVSLRANLIPMVCISRPSHDESRDVPGDRQRFTVAHELGHLALHSDLAPPQAADEASRIEKQANLFAGAFLAPGDALLEELSDHGGRVTLRTLAKIKERWGVSIKALVTRFLTLGVIDAEQGRSLYKQISARGWNKTEPVPVGNEQAVWLGKALAKRFAGVADAVEAASAEAGLGRSYLDRWTEWAPTSTSDGNAEVIDFKPRPAEEGRVHPPSWGDVARLPVRRM